MQLKLLFTVIGIVVTLFIFQNCGKAGFDGQDAPSTEDPTALEVDPKFKNLPFPYDISVNQIAFTNCNNPQSASSGGDFTVRAGAFDHTDPEINNVIHMAPAGISLSAEFYSDFQTIANKAYIKEYHEGKIREVLSVHPLAYGTKPYLGFRKQNAIRTEEILYDSPTNQRHFLLGTLSQSGFIETFSKSPLDQFNFFPKAPIATERYLEGALSFPIGSLDGATKVSTVLQSEGVLTLGFYNANKKAETSGTSSFVTLLGPDESEKAFGRGFYISSVSANNQPSTLESSAFTINDERDLSTGAQPTSGGRWDCSHVFKIVAEDDRMNCVFKKPGNSSSMISTGEWNDVCKMASKDGLREFLSKLDDPIRNMDSYKSKVFDNNYVDSYMDDAYNYMEPACPPMEYDDFVNKLTKPNPNAAFNSAAYGVLRRFLPPDTWDINIKYKCVVPKKGICYANNDKKIYDERFFKTNPLSNGSGPNGTYISYDYRGDSSVGYAGRPDVNFNISGVSQHSIGIKHPESVCTAAAGGGFECAKYLTMCVKLAN